MTATTQRRIDDPAADAALLLMRLGFAVLAFAVPLSAVVSRRAVFTLMPIGAALLIVAATFLPRPPVVRRLLGAFSSTAGAAALAVLVWTAAAIVWTPFPGDAAARWLKEAGTIGLAGLAAAFLSERTRTSNLNLFPLGLVPAALATAVYGIVGTDKLGVFQDPETTLERAVISLVVLVWPAVAALAVRERWSSAAFLVVGVTASAMAAWTPVALAALAAGAIAFSAATTAPRVVGPIIGAVAALALLLAPAIPFSLGPVLARAVAATGGNVPAFVELARVNGLWQDVVSADPIRLLTGHGLDIATRAATLGYLPPEIARSLCFELWYDLGFVGVAAAAVLIYGGFAAAGRTSIAVAPFLIAEIVAGLTLALWGLDTTELWWVTLLSVAGIAFAAVIRGQYRTERPLARVVPEVEIRIPRKA